MNNRAWLVIAFILVAASVACFVVMALQALAIGIRAANGDVPIEALINDIKRNRAWGYASVVLFVAACVLLWFVKEPVHKQR
jgi:hypothetical protein